MVSGTQCPYVGICGISGDEMIRGAAAPDGPMTYDSTKGNFLRFPFVRPSVCPSVRPSVFPSVPPLKLQTRHSDLNSSQNDLLTFLQSKFIIDGTMALTAHYALK